MAYDFRLGVIWLLSPRRKGRALTGHPTQIEILEYLEERFLDVDTDWLMSYVEPETSPIQRTCIATAIKFITDFRTAELVWRRNVKHGAVVRAPELVDQYNTILTELRGTNEDVVMRGHHMDNSTRCWARRLRDRTGCKVGCVSYSDKGLELEEMRAKAGVNELRFSLCPGSSDFSNQGWHAPRFGVERGRFLERAGADFFFCARRKTGTDSPKKAGTENGSQNRAWLTRP